MRNFDLHLHSHCSDGQLAPAELVSRAAHAGVDCLALTDHDTTAGLTEAADAARHGGVQLISGAEISVTWRNRTLHVVGLDFDPQDAALQTLLEQLQVARLQRAQRIAEKLEKQGVADCLPRVEALAGCGQITRTHFARLLVEDGLCSTVQEAFKRYLKPGRPGYSKAVWTDLSTAIQTLHKAGGVAVLAHPLSYGMTAAWQRRMLAGFAEAGGRAIEVVCGAYNAEQVERCAALARSHDMQGSVGSDFHAPEQRWLRLGRPMRLPPDIEPVWSRWTTASPLTATEAGCT